jgi:O-antigen/teichoic acid export membrane protein
VRHALYLGSGGALALVGVMYLGGDEWLVRSVVSMRDLADSIGLVTIWIIPMTLTLLAAEICRGFHDMRGAVLHGGLSVSLLTVVLLAVLYAFGLQMQLHAILVVSLGATLLCMLAALRAVQRHIRYLPIQIQSSLIGTLKVSLPLFITNAMIVALTQVDIWLVGAFTSAQDVAIYSAAAKLMFLVSVPLNIVIAVIQPMVAEYYSQGRTAELQRLLRVSATIAALPGVVALLCAMALAAPILGFLYGDVYASGAGVLIALALGQIVYVWTGASAIVLMMTGHERALMVLMGATGAVTVALMIALVKPFGINGVAIGSAIGIALQNLVMWLAARHYAGVWTNVGFHGMGEFLRLIRAERGRRRGDGDRQPSAR